MEVGQPSRRSGNYNPTLWPDSYIQQLKEDNLLMDERLATRAESLKDDVRHLLHEQKSDIDQLILIDSLIQLRVAYHFGREIECSLYALYSSVRSNSMLVKDDDLSATALFFRIFRDHGFDVPQDVFDSFKGEKGDFLPSLSCDIKGVLSLYEASNHVKQGEHTLDEARNFATKQLRDVIVNKVLDPRLRDHIKYTLYIPLHWRLTRQHALWFINAYEEQANMNPALLEFAKLDFSRVQNMHKRDLKSVSRSWSELGLLECGLDFARDRTVENYYGTIALACEPAFFLCRQALAPVHNLITVMDDIYDVYGTLNELELFTSAVDRWDANTIEELPQYMKIFFLALFNTTNDFAYKILKSKGVNSIPYLKKSWADLCKSYLVEAKWAHSGYTPSTEEYLENGWISISGPVILVHSFFCIAEEISKQALDSLMDYPNIIRYPSMILRLCNDLVTSKEEMRRGGDVKKAIQCYMHEENVSETAAHEHIRKLIKDAWKEMNTICFATSPFEKSFIDRTLNLARMAQGIYQTVDGFDVLELEIRDSVRSLNPFHMTSNWLKARSSNAGKALLGKSRVQSTVHFLHFFS